jgi:hypothetical protein
MSSRAWIRIPSRAGRSRRMATRRWLWFACVVAIDLLAGCAALRDLERQPDFAEYFTLRLGDRTEQARLEGRRLYGADIEVERLRDGYRGRVRNGIIDLRTDGERIFGTAATGPTDLHFDQLPDALFLTGMYGGKLGELEVRPDRIKGTIGGCTYDMSRHPDATWYRGTRVCAGRLGSAELTFPASLATRPPDERGVLLAIFLGH